MMLILDTLQALCLHLACIACHVSIASVTLVVRKLGHVHYKMKDPAAQIRQEEEQRRRAAAAKLAEQAQQKRDEDAAALRWTAHLSSWRCSHLCYLQHGAQ